MTYTTVNVNTTGPSYKSRSKPLSSQQTKNWYQQFNEDGKDKYVLMPFPGLKLLGNTTGIDRGLTQMAEVAYQVKGVTLYSIDKFGAHVSRGTIPGIGRCIFANDGINLFIVTDLKVYQYTTDTNLITQVTDSNITGSNSVDFINNQFLYTKGGLTTVNGQQVGPGYTVVSNVGDGSTASGLNIIGAESNPDALLRDYVYDQVIYRMGLRSSESWFNSGVGQPPIERLSGREFNIGLGAINSLAQTDNAFYWLGDDFSIYQSSNGTKNRISTDAISNELQTYSTVEDALGYTFTFEGQSFYALSFPTGGRTFVLSESLGVNGWFEISSGTDDGVYQGTSFVEVYGKTLVADKSNGNIYELDINTYQNNGEVLQRTRVTQTVDATLIGGSKKDRIGMSNLTIEMETGVGVVAGQGDNPRIMIEHSDDGGRTWSSGTWARVGRLGEFVLLVEFDDLGTFYSRIFRISTSDPVNYSVYSASIDLRFAGK